MSNLRRFLTGTSLCLGRKFHASTIPGISRAHFPSHSSVAFSPDSDMSLSAPQSKSEPSTVRVPQPIRTQTDPIGLMDKIESPPSAGPGAYDTSVVPPSHDARTIVLCFDGTGDQFDADVCIIFLFPRSPSSTDSRSQNSNIVQFFSMLKKDDKSQQMVYYQVCFFGLFVFLGGDGSNGKYFRLALGRTRFPRSRRRSGQSCKRRLTPPLATTLMSMSWVRRFSRTFMLLF
jgi:hypothetical protein